MKQNNKLIVSEIFYSLQGEGQTIGIPSVFLRLAGCNLLCKSSEWVCDTIEVWKKGRVTSFENIINDQNLHALSSGAHLVITGGEPLINQNGIILFLNWFRENFHFTPIIEIETNGTIAPNPILLDKIDYWNVSPKLPNSGMSYERRVNEAACKIIQSNGRNKIFKFVISKEEDIFSLGDEYDFILPNNIMLMPAGDSLESLLRMRGIVAELCKNHYYRFSDRLHITIWNQKTGV